MSFLGRLNYINQFIAQSTVVCEPIFKLLKKYAPTKWTEECQTAFDANKSYLSNPPVLVPPREGSPLLLYFSVSNSAFGCVLCQHDETGKKEKSIYYISKKFTPYEYRYTFLERTCCALTWLAQKLIHYLSSYTTYLISRMDPLKYIFQKAMPTGKLAKWQMLLKNPVDEEYEPLKTYFHDEEVSFVGEDISEAYSGWRLFFDGAANHQVKGVRAVLVSESGQHHPMAAKLRFNCTNNIDEYEACILGLKIAIDMNIYEFCKIEFRHTPRIQNELADALAIIASMIKHPDTDYIDPLDIELKEHPVHCSHVESEPDSSPWYFDIKSHMMKEICEQFKIIHRKSTAYRPQMNGAVEAANKNIKKILRKMIDKQRGWHEILPYALLGYRTTVRTSTGVTPYLLVYGTEAVVPVEVEIPSLRIIQEDELSNAECVSKRIDQLALIYEKRMVVVCHG
ncbi:uncharacterized protein [Solanum lycopersicum]|uniref:uncharacterized protein n=1 Tax=Solanum lycopersicum TaxID=4081 RepID=UPI0037483BC9